ncbi:MAG: apolipoprotein N-acyltransferase, partial [Phycisphaerales bacterium]
YLVDGDPPYQRYDKHFLTPFGETMPYISAWPWLEQRLLALGAEGMRFNLDSNPQIKRLRLDWNDQTLRLATPICFEDTVAWLCRKMVYTNGAKTAEVLVNLSNDGWFGVSASGRRQHVQIARFRCVENRVPMVRAANTGLSVVIDSRGKLIDQIGEGRYGAARTQGTLLAEPLLDSRSTLYGRLGDVWAWLCLIGTFVLGGSAIFLGAKEPES